MHRLITGHLTGAAAGLGRLWTHVLARFRRPVTLAAQWHQTTTPALIHNHGPLLIANRILRILLHAGVPISILGNPVYLLSVRGRKSGQPRRFAVDPYEHHNRRFLLASHGISDWVRNLRAAGQGSLQRGRRQQAIKVVELSPEAAGAVLKEILPLRLSAPMRGFVLRRTLGITPDASLAEFIDVARRCPVFEINDSGELS